MTRVGRCLLFSVLLAEVPAPPQEPKRKNLIQNSSFEEAALPGWPDGWRIANPLDQMNGFARATYVHEFAANGASRGGIPVEVGKTYVFSVYLRAEKKGTAAQLHLMNCVWSSPVDKEGASQRFVLDTQWRRYQVACTIPREGWTRGLRPEVMLSILSQAVNSSIWADAAQLEEGSQATAYVCE